jgi:NADH-quinone oxidoreductase subunit J
MLTFGTLMILSALCVVLARKPFTSAMWLICTLVLLAINYALLNADFLAVVQILVYAGVTAVLIVLIMMLLGVGGVEQCSRFTFNWFIRVAFKCVVAVIFFLCLSTAYYYSAEELFGAPSVVSSLIGSVENIGAILFSKYSGAVILLGGLFLTTIIGVVIIAQEKRRPLPPGHGLTAKQSAICEPSSGATREEV